MNPSLQTTARGQMSERDTRDTRLGSANFASHMLRRAIVVLMVLVPLSAIYAFVFGGVAGGANADILFVRGTPGMPFTMKLPRSEEHTSELQSQSNLVCRLLLEKKKQKNK